LIDLRRRTPALLLAVVLGHVVLISVQVNTASGVRVFEAVTFGLFSEVQRAVARAVGGVTGVWNGYVGLRSVQAENDALRENVAALRFRLQQEHALAQRMRGLEELLELRRDVGFSTVSARVIAGDATPYFRTVTIDRGTGDGVYRDSAVVSPDGVVGRVVGNPGPRAAKVQLLVDRSAAAGAIIERTLVAGVVVGNADQGVLRMEYVSNLEAVQLGDIVVTSGIDGIYPKGFVIGEVEVVHRGPRFYKTIHVRPKVVFSDLEDVLVIVREPASSTATAGGA
jgi:rod shape-determining protein MreC